MIETFIIFVTGVVFGVFASQVRLRLMREKVELYESYIHHRLEETVPFVKKRLRFP